MIRSSAEERPAVSNQWRENTGARAEGAMEHSVGQPEQIAAAAVWLCSEEASFVNGESMVVDGGTITR